MTITKSDKINALVFWPSYGTSSIIVGKGIEQGFEQLNDSSICRRDLKVPYFTSPIQFSIPITKNLNLSNSLFDSYFTRLVVYPPVAKVSSLLRPADVYHIIDDSNGNLVHMVTPQRCIISLNHATPEIIQHPCFNVPKESYAFKVFNSMFHSILQARFIVTASEYVRQNVLAHHSISPERVISNHYGYNKLFYYKNKDYRFQTRITHQIGSDWFVLLNVGNHAPYKNIEAILLSLIALPENIHFVSVGETWNASEQQIIDHYKLHPRVHRLGPLSTEELARCYGMADVYVCPSLVEGFGMTMLEAMASGIPVITSNMGVMAEVAGYGAKLIDPYSHEDLIRAILELYYFPQQRDELQQAALKRVKDFSWRKYSEKVAELYKIIYKENQYP